MLKFDVQEIVQRHLKAAVYSFRVLCQKPFSTLTTVMVIAVALTLPTLCWVMGSHVQKMTESWQNRPHLSVYLIPHQDVSNQKRILSIVAGLNGVEHATLKTPEEGLHDLEKQEGMQDLMHYLPDNPLPAVIEVIPDIRVDTPSKLTQLSQHLQQMSGVAQVRIDLAWVRRLHAILSFVRTFTTLLMGLLAAAVLLVIGNTLRLEFHRRHEEIQVLKLIGATDAYVLRPFVYAGIWYGLMGAVMTILLTNLFLVGLSIAIDRVAATYAMHVLFLGMTLTQAYLVVLFSSFLGYIASQCFVRNQISSIEVG